MFHGVTSARVRCLPPQIKGTALYKLDILNAAQSLEDLMSPPGNRLEALKGHFSGLYSIRINNQWRIAFRWIEPSAHEIKIIDYH
ncbi:type II toxin-antitoxin system RelE/ParE family toxin [Thiorhodovibrio winogradskyi]|uniref:type II toxin-antitoxin system RelE/ParE family toxin n=1 Tax=Thiorhodovibrio winogradskyi TaxID=77007 RepID=UPI002E288A1B|nr:type II toxin-antitoxin system RelE/ParE family toxin [Thiorhodovibrio winogradskyi]